MKRRTFLRTTLTVGTTLSLGGSRVLGANDAVRLGALGVGSNVKIGGKGRQDVRDFQKIAGVRVVALCDCDTDHLGIGVEPFKKRGESVKAYRDFRRLLDDREIDAVTIATPNHWHAPMAIFACQAGKDVFVQKPASHNLFEGRKMVEAARKYKRIVQATHGPRNNGSFEEAFEYARAGNLGKVLFAHGLNYRPRSSIGKVDRPQPIPTGCDYDLWCGPAPKKPLMRKYLHYDFHWDWDTGSGDLGNMGIHYMDACRWALGYDELPPRVITVGARVGYDDDGQTPNSLITLLDYEPVPILFEVRGLPVDAAHRQGDWSSGAMDEFRGVRIGTFVHCEGGYVQGDTAYDNSGKPIKTFTRERVSTKQNFIDTMRTRRADQLHTDALEGHLSAGLVHMTNISYRVGRQASNEAIHETIRAEKPLSESFDRLQNHLEANRIDLGKKPLCLGPMLTMDPAKERFVGSFSEEANKHLSRDYRKPFVVPEDV